MHLVLLDVPEGVKTLGGSSPSLRREGSIGQKNLQTAGMRRGGVLLGYNVKKKLWRNKRSEETRNTEVETKRMQQLKEFQK